MNNFATWLKAKDIRQKAFANRIGCDQSVVSRLANNEMRPSLPLAVAIERETGGEIPVASWVQDQTGDAA